MSDLKGTRAERIARYKEDRRKQLATQFSSISLSQDVVKKRTGTNKEIADEPRTTRASRLRAAACAQDSTSSSHLKNDNEKIPSPSSIATLENRRKSSFAEKSKPITNRSQNVEISEQDKKENILNGRARRLPSTEALKPTKKKATPTSCLQNGTSTTLTKVTSLPNVRTSKKLEFSSSTSCRKVSISDIKMSEKRSTKKDETSSVKNNDTSESISTNSSSKLVNKENINGIKKSPLKIDSSKLPLLEKDRVRTSVSRRVDELTVLTNDAIERVQKLSKSSNIVKRATKTTSNIALESSSSSESQRSDIDLISSDDKADTRVPLNCDFRKTHSILKNKSLDEPFQTQLSTYAHNTASVTVPVSILKRKISQDDFNSQGGSSSTSTPPVTFSPSVVDPATNRQKQGILKKRRSLDESQVLRHRSCSPEVALNSRSILKKQRRSSLENIRRTQSPESALHGILKRRSSRYDEESDSVNNSPEPQSILKRKSGSSSAGSTANSPHVSIATAVILAAARGAEMILDDFNEGVRPILKKRSSSDEQPNNDGASNEVPKPILKKKASTDSDDYEDKPRPILKRMDKDLENGELGCCGGLFKYSYQNASDDSGVCEVRPILKTSSRDNSPRPRLSFCADTNNARRVKKSSRRPHTICTGSVQEGGNLYTSVSDMVLNFEQTSTGAIPKVSKSKRHNERYNTQPVTSQELQISLGFIEQDHQTSGRPLSSPILKSSNSAAKNTQSLSNLTSGDIENSFNSCLSSSFINATLDSGVSIKMSSDSAFQSLGDGLELEREEKISPKTSCESLPQKGGRSIMKSLAEEAKNMQLRKRDSTQTRLTKQKDINIQRPTNSRFSTQPVTLSEVQEASNLKNEADLKLDKSDPSRLSISERIQLFSAMSTDKIRLLPKPRLSRFQTHPVTLEEIESARIFPKTIQNSFALGSSKNETKTESARLSDVSSRQSLNEFTRDEGISSEERDSGSDLESDVRKCDDVKSLKWEKSSEKCSKISESSENKSAKSFAIGKLLENNITTRRKPRETSNNDNIILKSKSYNVIRDEDNNSNLRRSLTSSKMPKSIAELQAKLQKSGDNEWRKRIPKLNNANEELGFLNVKNIYNEELTEKTSILAARKDELDAAAKQWRNRVEQSDAVNFSVAGRMQQKNDNPRIPINLPVTDTSKRTPRAKAFKGREGGDKNEIESAPVSPEKKVVTGFKRSVSLPGAGDNNPPIGLETISNATSRKVRVERPDDITFKSFYKSVDLKQKVDFNVTVDDFNSVVRQTQDLLVQKRTIRVQRRREASKNPVKALAARTDIVDEYTEVITGVAEREKQRLNIERLAKTSNFAVEALAGLASKENFSSVALKRSSSLNSNFPPFKNLMLLQVKGRRFVQTRLVEPIVSSINEGDDYILITPNSLYHYIGAYSNVIEQSRASDIVNSIHKTNDLGCKTQKIVIINSKRAVNNRSEGDEQFWQLLGSNNDTTITPAGHPDEDEMYESSILRTNMMYEYKNEELVPIDQYWGTIPKIEMLSPLKIIVFDFGSEMYVWSGKNALLEDRKKALKLAEELRNEGYNYVECDVNPIEISHMLGSRESPTKILKNETRPKWTLFAKITQHGETVLFKEKFLDWPDYTRVIQVKHNDNDKSVDTNFNFKPCDIHGLLKNENPEPDLVIDGIHLGRGKTYFDEETNRLFNFTTNKITCWVILEYSHEEIQSLGQFHDGNSYIIRWEFCGNITGRELSGKASKHMQVGRDYCVYFCWQGSKATVNEKGAAALLTVTLDSENARQIRISQGTEPPAFLSLFQGGMVIHSGKREKSNDSNCRLYICLNEVESETFLSEVPCSMRSLRSRSTFISVSSKTKSIIIWNGSRASNESKKAAKRAVNKIVENQSSEFGFADDGKEVTVESIDEGFESDVFLSLLGGEKRQLYLSLLKTIRVFDYSPKLFNLTSLSGNFEAVQILCSYRNEHLTAYPFLQSDLYSANQPALFMLDNGFEVWLWQGWWPELEDDCPLIDQTGTGAIRWQEERKAAMQTVVDYCKNKTVNGESVSAYLVWAGLEPLAFTNLFPNWEDHDEITALNIREGRKPGEAIVVENELALLTRSTYPLDQLMQRPLPDGVDPIHLENYLSPEDFFKIMSMPLEEFKKLPTWKQTTVKKEKGLF